ncbi:hypothetical protein KPZU09_46930 [Klebsiella pneumoniae]|jgi:hypothetical protein|uniref:Uncharacterized protein n=1 Tax=Klebsiella pneumoniae TaxID=573 RepID=A0A919M0W2_KLEPN|nr:hypothetical protein KPZU09_46930 [Klebsiella pneumoniae]
MGGGKADAGLVLAVKIDAGELKLAPVVARTPFNTGKQLATAAFPSSKLPSAKRCPPNNRQLSASGGL